MYQVLPLLCLLVACVSGIPPRTRWTTNYNDNLDAVLKRVKKYGPEMGLDPMKLPDINRTMTVNILFGEVSGGIVNIQGILTGGTTLRRSGDATIRIEGSYVYIDSDIDFVTLNYEYTSVAEFIGLVARGKTSGVINDLQVHITLRVDAANPYYGEEELENLTVKHTGGLTVHYDNGMSILDEFIDSISDIFTDTFKEIIINSVRTVMVSNATLVKIAAYGGFFVVGAGYFMRNKIEEGIKKSDYFRESMKQMRTHQGVVSLFGEPIKDGRLNLGENGTNFCDGTQAQFQVPVKGPKAKGTLHLWAERMTYEQPWDVYRLELELKDMPDRIIVLRNVPSKCASSEGS